MAPNFLSRANAMLIPRIVERESQTSASPVPSAGSSSVGSTKASSSALVPTLLVNDSELMDLKARRQLKFKRDWVKRHSADERLQQLQQLQQQRAQPASTHHQAPGSPHWSPSDVHSKRNDLVASDPWVLPSRANTHGRPRHDRHDRNAASPRRKSKDKDLHRDRDNLQLLLFDEFKKAGSVGANSWPPSNDVHSTSSGLNPLENNRLAQSAPADASLLLSSAAEMRRESRPITLFESAVIFTATGERVSHEEFDELSASPVKWMDQHFRGTKKKLKRRTARKWHDKPTKSNSSSAEVLATRQESIVLELMRLLMPDVDVAHELNLQLLVGKSKHGGVFDFEDEDELLTSVSNPNESKVDLVQFQSTLTKLVFVGAWSAMESWPLASADFESSKDMLEHYFDDRWIRQTILEVVMWDALAQRHAFTVVLALFKSLPCKRLVILDALASSSSTIFELKKSEESLRASGLSLSSTDRSSANVQGIVFFLEMVLSAPFGLLQNDNFLDDGGQVNKFCDRVLLTVKYLVRDVGFVKGSQNESQNQFEKFEVGSDATQVKVATSVESILVALAMLSPAHGMAFLQWTLMKWPRRDVYLQLFGLRYITRLLVTFMMHGIFLGEDLVIAAFDRICRSISSSHCLMAREACSICGQLALMDAFLLPNPLLRDQVMNTLHETSRTHWNAGIRQLAEESFDGLLDLA